MERANISGLESPAQHGRGAIALGAALGLHGLLFAVLSSVPEKPMAEPKAPIAVRLVVLERPPSPEPEALEESPPEPEPVSQPIERLEPRPPSTEPALVPLPSELPLETPQTQSPPQPPPPVPPSSAPLSILSTEDEETGEAIPEQWRLPPGARIPLENAQQSSNANLQALSTAIECLGFDADCAAQRKEIFSEEQLNGTDLVWMPTYAHSGLSDSRLYGLSEAEIRERLGIPTAGVNGIYVPFTNIGLDGAWWDALHGVNKACGYRWIVNKEGVREVQKVCEELKGGADSIPLYRTGNEFQRSSVD